ncbi:MAG: hypothetical protein AAF383_01315 [Cyanobacteria bacterium P01_A01_bin.83]
MNETFNNIYLPCVEPLLDTWGVTKRGGDWSITPSDDLSNTSVEERNTWYAQAMMSTIEAFSSLARVYIVSFEPVSRESEIGSKTLKWDLEEPYKNYLENVYEAVKNYPVDIYILYVRLDFFVYVRTEKSPDKPIRSWIRKCSDFYNVADIHISIEHLLNYEPDLSLIMNHTLFYPDSWIDQIDNTELFKLNRPLLEEALKNWEQKFDAEIETDGLPQIYKYGFLPY